MVQGMNVVDHFTYVICGDGCLQVTTACLHHRTLHRLEMQLAYSSTGHCVRRCSAGGRDLGGQFARRPLEAWQAHRAVRY